LAWHVAHIGEKRNAYRLLVGKPEGKRQLGRSRRRWVDNIRMDFGVGNHFADKRRSLGRYSSLADSDHGVCFVFRILERWNGVMWTGLIWLRLGTGGELFC
jgi:hypothetical protein